MRSASRERTSASSRTTESSPPENPTHTRDPASAASGISLRDFLELAIVHQAILAALEERIDRQVLERAQRVLDRLLEVLRRIRGVAMGAAERLVDHLVDQAQRLQARRGDAQALGRLARVLRALPEDRRAPFG